MKIVSVRATPLSIPLRPARPPSAWAPGLAKQVVVEVATDEGVTGWGEAFAYGAPLAVASVVQESLAPLVEGEAPTPIEPLIEKLQRALMIWGRRGLGMFALSGVELALWDLAGKLRGLPVHALLGAGAPKRLRAYTSLLRFERPDEVAAAAEEAARRGFTAIKLHQVDVASVAAVRSALGADVELMLDVNCPWTEAEAIRQGRALAAHRLRWLEEPVWPPDDYAALARVAEALDTPIAAGENESTLPGFDGLMRARAADILQPSITKVGGLAEARRICALAAAEGFAVVPHSFYLGPGMAATLHLAGSLAAPPLVELAGFELEASLLDPPLAVRDGWIELPDRPGLGFEVDREAVRRYPHGGGAKALFAL
jgi:L-alanine-DL-glutamate epimerase-like enolase superfamily enzyme